jgi:hypothetical protein
VLKYYLFDIFVTLNGTAFVTYGLENAFYCHVYRDKCTKQRIKLICNKHAFIVLEESNAILKRNKENKTQ